MSSPLEDQSSLVGILNRVQAWAVAADQKIGVVTAIQTLICGFLFNELSGWLGRPDTTTLITLALYVACGLLVLGIGFCAKGLFPNVHTSPGKSVTFFGTIQSWSLADYRATVAAMDEAAWRDDYTGQIHANAVITLAKHAAIKNSVKAFSAGLLVIAVAYFAALAGF